MENYIQSAEKIAHTINMQLAKNVPEFKKLFDDYNDAYGKLSETITTKSEEETINELVLAVKKHLNHAMLREIFAFLHPDGRHTFFYFNKEFLMTDSKIKCLVERIKALFPLETHEACFEFIKCYKRMMKFYEKEMCTRTSKFVNECYKYYC